MLHVIGALRRCLFLTVRSLSPRKLQHTECKICRESLTHATFGRAKSRFGNRAKGSAAIAKRRSDRQQGDRVQLQRMLRLHNEIKIASDLKNLKLLDQAMGGSRPNGTPALRSFRPALLLWQWQLHFRETKRQRAHVHFPLPYRQRRGL